MRDSGNKMLIKIFSVLCLLLSHSAKTNNDCLLWNYGFLSWSIKKFIVLAMAITSTFLNNVAQHSVINILANAKTIMQNMIYTSNNNTTKYPVSSIGQISIPRHTIAIGIISSVNNITKVVMLMNIEGTASSYTANEFKNLHMKVGNIYWLIASNTDTTVTLDTQLDISGLSGVVELVSIQQKNFATTLTDKSNNLQNYEYKAINAETTSKSFVLDENIEIDNALSLTVKYENDILIKLTASQSVSNNADIWIQKVVPTHRYGHTAVIKSDKMYIFGGISMGKYLNDLWECDLNTFTWMQRKSGPIDRSSHTAIVNADKMYVFGGSGPVFLNDLWECDLTTFTWTSKGIGATARFGHAAVAYNGKMYIFGGFNGASFSNDLWECDLSTFVWTPISSGSTARVGSSVVINGSKLYLFGGYTGKERNDLWECDLDTFQWTSKKSGATVRHVHTAIINNGKMYIFGGYTNGANLNDLWECDLSTFAWLQKTSAATTRHGHSAVIDKGNMFIFGGWDEFGYNNDLWECNLSTFEWALKD